MNTIDQDSRRHTRTRLPALALALAVTIALGTGFAVVVYAADPRLDEADQALQKAEALLLSSSAAGTSPKVQKQFDRDVGRAVDLIDRARAHVKAAKDAVDDELGLASAPQQAGAAATP